MTSRAPICPACSSNETQFLARLPLREQHRAYAAGDGLAGARLDSAYGAAPFAFTVLRCSHCALEYTLPARAPSGDWYAELYSLLPLYPQQRWEYGVVADALRAEEALVDYGCGNGNFLLGVRGRVRYAFGFDFARESVAAAVRQGLNARRLDLDGPSQLPPLPVPADHVVAFHVLEHLPQPRTLFDFARAIAAPGARLWVAVPSDRRASRLHGEPDLLDEPPHHLTRWSEAALREVGHRNGWKLDRHLYEPLPVRTAVWEATRRLPWFARLQSRSRLAERGLRRALALGVWTLGLHRRPSPSGFSMLACYTLAKRP